MIKITNTKTQWVDEYYEGVRYGLQGKILIDETSPYQRIQIVDSDRYGKSLLLDNCWMTAESQEKQYHESLVHPAMCSSSKIQNILIIGGGDGGTARECLKYQGLKNLDLVEIDARVIELSKEFLPSIGENAWKDSRLNIQIKNGVDWVNNAQDDSYDVILIDGSDPIGPAKGLFNKTFFENCRRILCPGGILATQSESPEAHSQLHIDIVKILRTVFDYADPLYGSVPMYPSGWWSWTFACMQTPRFRHPKEDRASHIAKTCTIWSIKWQKGSFDSIPAFIDRELNT